MLLPEPSLREILAEMFPGEKTGTWRISFDDDGVSVLPTLRDLDTGWVLLDQHALMTTKRRLIEKNEERDRLVHLSHCNADGEGTCKYGEDATCPALVDFKLVDADDVLREEGRAEVIARAKDYVRHLRYFPGITPQVLAGAETMLRTIQLPYPKETDRE